MADEFANTELHLCFSPVIMRVWTDFMSVETASESILIWLLYWSTFTLNLEIWKVMKRFIPFSIWSLHEVFTMSGCSISFRRKGIFENISLPYLRLKILILIHHVCIRNNSQVLCEGSPVKKITKLVWSLYSSEREQGGSNKAETMNAWQNL